MAHFLAVNGVGTASICQLGDLVGGYSPRHGQNAEVSSTLLSGDGSDRGAPC